MVRFQSDGQGAALLSVFALNQNSRMMTFFSFFLFFFAESNFILPWAILSVSHDRQTISNSANKC